MTPGTVINLDRCVVIDVLTLSKGMECIFPYTPMSVFSIRTGHRILMMLNNRRYYD